jgi:hypothetical protein
MVSPAWIGTAMGAAAEPDCFATELVELAVDDGFVGLVKV